MNAFWLTMLGSVARTAVGAASGYAVARGTITAQDAQVATDVLGAAASGAPDAVVGAVGVAATLGWSIWQKLRANGAAPAKQ